LDFTTEENQLTGQVIAAAIEVHRILGPGLLESIYEKALCCEFSLRNISFENQKILPVMYKGEGLGEYRLDFLVNNELVVELKAVDRFDPVFEAQILTYMKITQVQLGLLINFNVPLLKNGIKRMVLSQKE